MRLGFTGTRKGMTALQRATLVRLLLELNPIEFHHGLCRGADVEAHDCVNSIIGIKCRIIGHPAPAGDPWQESRDCDELAQGKNYLARNRDIVAESDRLIATPAESEHQSRGGTWYTVDHARKKGVPVTIIWPDGRTQEG